MRTQLPTKGSPYPYVRLWCRYMGSYEYYAVLQVEAAKLGKAPADAVFEETGTGGARTGTWVRMTDVNNAEFAATCRLWDAGVLRESDGWVTITDGGVAYFRGRVLHDNTYGVRSS